MPFYVKSSIPNSTAYHTGEFDRSLPPCPYITENLNDAASWSTRESAQSWANQFGGEVVEFDDEYLKELDIVGSTTFNTEVVGLEMDGEDVIVTLRIPKAKQFANKKWGFTTKMSLEVFE